MLGHLQAEERARGVVLDGGVEEEIGRIAASLDLEHHSIKEPLFRKVYFRPIMLAMVIAAFNQLSGINALLYYAPTVFGMAGVGQHAALAQAVGMGVTNLVFTIIALLVIDHFGRKKLMIIGAIGYILSLGATTWAFHVYADDFAASARAAAFNQRALKVCHKIGFLENSRFLRTNDNTEFVVLTFDVF